MPIIRDGQLSIKLPQLDKIHQGLEEKENHIEAYRLVQIAVLLPNIISLVWSC